MTQMFCNYLDKLSRLEREQGKLGVITGMLSLIVMFIFGLLIMGIGAYIAIGAATELINRIFF